MKPIKKILSTLMMFCSFSSVGQITPFFSSINEIDFGTIMFLTGSCEMDYTTGELSNISGALCPYENDLGTPGKYTIYANPFKQVSVRVTSRTNTGDNFLFVPAGVFEVSGLPDVLVVPDTTQLIDTGSTGIINIKLGGRLTSIEQRSASSTYTFENIDGIDWFEVP